MATFIWLGRGRNSIRNGRSINYGAGERRRAEGGEREIDRAKLETQRRRRTAEEAREGGGGGGGNLLQGNLQGSM